MAASRSQTIRQSLHLYIDPSPYHVHPLPIASPDASTSPSVRSTTGTIGTIGTTASTSTSLTTPIDEWNIFSVLCLHEFQTTDTDQLGFRKNEILEVVKQEESGWWAAMRRDENFIGWIPANFVVPLSEEMSEKLRNIREELRIYEYTAEELYNNAATAPSFAPLYDSEPELSPSPTYPRRNYSSPRNLHSPRNYQYLSPQSEAQSGQRSWPYPPPSPSTPMPQPPVAQPLYIDKPTPPTPKEEEMTSPRDPAITRARREGIMRFDSLSRKGSTRQPIPAQIPWYLRPRFADQLDFDSEGHVRFGTLVALVEKLASDSFSTKEAHKLAEDMTFRNIFLMTFRTFMTADQLFDMLVERYRMNHPEQAEGAEYEDWKERFLLPTQKRVLTIFTMWLEDHRLLEEEPHIAGRMTEFLTFIAPPSLLATTAKLIIQSIERLTFANPSQNPSVQPKRRRRSRAHKGDLLRMDAADLAEQLALLEHKNYVKISPQECITYSSSQMSPAVANLCAFCGTHDKLGAWVKMSILTNEALGKRADTVDFWIKVAEKCRNLHNYASMSSLITALSSTVISKLHLTWAHVGRKSALDNLLKYNEPSGGFAGYRLLLSNVEGSCVPFIGMYLTDICHIGDQYPDDGERISFIRRQRWFETVSAVLRYQSRPYNIAESESTRNYILTNLQIGSLKDPAWFWVKSKEVQETEMAHADIRRGLEAAGF
ncbi:ras GEF [Pluteus cervinus]|uniref:Ras GEF n=1 Tax=Pluteus cervinus TaxID=181527 RepID=A0ACD3BHW5_9AGAR|nr:ras GEF [Pluteus cervinus]